MKPLIATVLIAMTVAVATPASALNIHIGPRGVGVRLGHPHVYRHFHRRGFVGHRHFYRHGFRRF